MVNVGTGKAGSRYLKTNWPIDEGLTAGTTKLPEQEFLIPEKGSNVTENQKVGLY